MSLKHSVLSTPTQQPLDPLFKPRTVAVIGATEKEGSVGRTILWNLISNPFGGTVFPVNPKRPSILGIKAYPSIGEVPEKVDLAVIITPAPAVPPLIKECVQAGVPGVIVISAGFKELGPSGEELEQQIMEHKQGTPMRIIGPNCLGVMNPLYGLNATFAKGIARPGNVGFISQSGALCTAILDWSLRENVGFSNFISIGRMLDVGWGDLIYYLGDDPQTKSIVIYMESIGDARSFLSAAREVALSKPIIVIKAGRTEAAAKAAASHTGSLTGSDEVLDAAFRRTGVLRVDNIADLFYMAEVLGKQPRPKGPNLTILTNAGGPGVLATDALITNGASLTELSEEQMDAFNAILPPHWSRNNPIDILGDAGPDRYSASVEVAAKDPNSDGLLVILTPQDMTDPTQTAQSLTSLGSTYGKPILASWMGGADVEAGRDILNRVGIPTFQYPDMAAKVFAYMWRYSYNQRGLYETPALAEQGNGTKIDSDAATAIIDGARNAGRTILTEQESKAVLAAYGMPVVPMHIAASADEAVKAADGIGYPVVLKIHSETITHKTDVGGVQLNLADENAVREAFALIERSVAEKVGAEHFLGVTVQPMIKLDGYEIILGSSCDPQFGPVLLFGTGGQLVEVFRDRSLALPPLNTTLARRMMEQTKIYKALQGVRGRPPVDLAALEQILVRFSRLVSEHPWIKEVDINPMLASHEQLVALDARVVLHDTDMDEADLPRAVIRPYPTQYVRPWTLKNKVPVTIRPIRPEDEPLMVKFHEKLSERTVFFRYLQSIDLKDRVEHERLVRMCFIDYNQEMALVAEHVGEDGEREVLGVARLHKLHHDPSQAEFAVVVSDAWQGQGLGTELVRSILDVGRDENLSCIMSLVHSENANVQEICRNLGFGLDSAESGTMIASIDL